MTALQSGLTVRIRCLGPAQVSWEDDERIKFETRKHVLLLYYLARTPGRPVSRDELIDLFWNGDEERKARHSLSHAVSLINKSLKAEAIVPAGPSRLVLSEGIVWLDVREFERLVAEGQFIEARALWGGTLFEGYWIRRAPQVEEWLANERSRVERTVRRVLHELIEEHRAAGDHEMMRREAEVLLDLDELDEKAMLAYLESLTLMGDRTLALRRFAEFEKRIAQELQAAPNAQLLAWAKRQRQSTPPTAAVSRIEQPSVPPAQPMYGRDSEFSLLWEAWEQTRGGRGRVILIRGEAGIGKSTLLGRLANQAHVSGAAICYVRCFRSEKAIPFAPVPSIVRQLSRLPGFIGVAGTWLGELTRIAPEIRDRFPALPTPMAIDDSSRHRLSDATLQAVEAVSEEQPLLVTVDDLQDADEATLALLHYLGRHAKRLPLLMVFGLRSSSEHSEVQRDFLASVRTSLGTVLELGGLNHDSVERLIRQVLAREGKHSSESMVGRLVLQARGNPLQAIEAALATLSDSAGATAVTSERGFDETALERLRTLPPEAQSIASALAVAERTLSEYELSEISRLQPAQMASALQSLEQAHFIRSAGREVGLAHERYGAVIATHLEPKEASGYHYRIARRLSLSAATNANAHFEVAKHYQASGRIRPAIAHARKAASFAESIGATRERAAALEVLLAIGDTAEDLIADLGQCYLDLNDLSALRPVCNAGRASGKEHLNAEADYLEAMADTHGFDTPLPQIEARLSQLVRGPSFKHAKDARLNLVLIADKTGNYELVRQTTRELRRGIPREHWTEHTYFTIGYVFAKYYWPSRAIPFLERAVQICQQTKNWTLEQFGRDCLAIALKLTGRFRESIEHYQHSLALARKVLNPQAEARCLQNRAVSEMALGDLDAAWATLGEAPASDFNLISHDYTSYNQGVILFHRENYSQAMELFLSTFERAFKTNHALLASDACGFAAMCAQRQNDHRKFTELARKLRTVEPTNRNLRLGYVAQAVAAWTAVIVDNHVEDAVRILEGRAKELARRDIALWAATKAELIVLQEALSSKRATEHREELLRTAERYEMHGFADFASA